MRVALLSAGPSLHKSYDPAVPYDHRIGVNTAVQFYPCDWWACADSHRWIEIFDAGVIGKPRVFQIDAQRDRTQCFEFAKFEQYQWTGWDEVFEAVGANPLWMSNTGPAALVLAAWLGATEIHCFGVDMAGHLDVTEVIDDSTRHRNPPRWEKERKAWDEIVAWLTDRGVKVYRNGIQP